MNLDTLLKTIAQIPEDLAEILSKVRLLPLIVTALSKMEDRIMSTLSDFEAFKPKVLELIDKLNQSTDQSQQLADVQKQLAEALADDKADEEAIDAANAKAAELQAAADAKAQEDAQLTAEIAQLSQQIGGDAPATATPAPVAPVVEPDPVAPPVVPATPAQ
ncbi:MAG: hypothetical protein KME45_03480 [Stenomitos rutilans HA7619-LM2]|nr:hypothetical protein [Stenomitos rutilans HA7619-LM2]MBW4469447.1 hypothetical protein [Stenomitos rutilans HA7619-LM2]